MESGVEQILVEHKQKQNRKAVQRYFVGGCDPWYGVMDSEIYDKLPWYRRAFSPPKAAIVASGTSEEMRKLCDRLNAAYQDANNPSMTATC